MSRVAKAEGVSTSTLSRWCKAADPPIVWDRTPTAAANEAVTVDMKARRLAIAEGLLDDVDKIRGMFFAGIPRAHFSVTLGRQEYEAPPSPSELQSLLIAAGIGLDKHLILTKFDTDDRDLPAVDAWLEHILTDGDTP